MLKGAVLVLTGMPVGTTDGTLGATFEKTRSYAVEGEPSSEASTDFDGDGSQDIAVANYVDAGNSVPTNLGAAARSAGPWVTG